MTRRMTYHQTIGYVARCDVDECQWRQEHRTWDDAKADGERHLEEWHPVESDAEEPPKVVAEQPKVVDLMRALEASLAAVKERRAK